MQARRIHAGVKHTNVKAAWSFAWMLLAPFAVWLALTKITLVLDAIYTIPRYGDGVAALARWFWHFTSLRVVAMVVVAYGLQRLFLVRRPWTIVPIAATLLLAMASGVVALKPDENLWSLLGVWSETAWGQFVGIAQCLWRDVATVGLLVFAFGAFLQLTPARASHIVVVFLQVLVAVLCALAGIDLAYQLATGQPISLPVLHYVAGSPLEMIPLIASETTPFRVFAIAGGPLLALGWFVRLRGMRCVPEPLRLAWPSAVGPALGALALLLPVPSGGLVQLLRHSEATLIVLARSAATNVGTEAQLAVRREFDRTGRPRWHSTDLKLVATPQTRRANVVIVMLESIRAKSTSLDTPRLDTTPFLESLARRGMDVRDMNAVIPRTAAAWIAVLAGQYPLANEATARWASENNKLSRLRGLPTLLGEIGWQSAFFTPTRLEFQSDHDVIRALGFGEVSTVHELTRPGAKDVTYFGIADSYMLAPVLDWSEAQVRAGKPFMATLMTNVGHHDFHTPDDWPKRDFPEVTDPALAAYYNCLLYIDDFLRQLVEGYDRLGVLDNTVFVILGDHGQMFSEHDAKQTYNALYQEGLHVPAVVYAPGFERVKGRVEGPRQQIDVLPTIADLLKLRIEGGSLPGESLLEPVDKDRKLFFSSSIERSFLGARVGSLKYIYDFGRSPLQVYDIRVDPAENAAIGSAVSAEARRQIEREMLEWRAASELSSLARPDKGAKETAPWRSH